MPVTVKRTKDGAEHYAAAWDDRGLVTRWELDADKAKPANEDEAAKIARTHGRRAKGPVGTLVFLDGEEEVNRVDGKGGEQGQEVTVKVQGDAGRVKELEAENARLKKQVEKQQDKPDDKPPQDKPAPADATATDTAGDEPNKPGHHGHRRGR